MDCFHLKNLSKWSLISFLKCSWNAQHKTPEETTFVFSTAFYTINDKWKQTCDLEKFKQTDVIQLEGQFFISEDNGFI